MSDDFDTEATSVSDEETFQGFDNSELDTDEETDLSEVVDMRLENKIYTCSLVEWRYFVNRQEGKYDWITARFQIEDEDRYGRTFSDNFGLHPNSKWKIKQLRAAIDHVAFDDVKSVRLKDTDSWVGSQVNVRIGDKRNNQTKQSYKGPIEYLETTDKEPW